MTAGTRRERIVYFRISQDEFEQIVKACEARGSRSVSDLARAAVHRFITEHHDNSAQQMLDTVQALRAIVDDVRLSVQQLMAKVDGQSQAPVEKTECSQEPDNTLASKDSTGEQAPDWREDQAVFRKAEDE